MSTIPDAVSAAPDVYRVLLENDRVRVLDVQMKPGAKSSMHSHPDLVSYSLNPGRLRFTLPSGESMEVELRPGEALRLEAPTHATENIGTTETHDLTIELKRP
jgi:quercetin dioxygenase-like cupin family protein